MSTAVTNASIPALTGTASQVRTGLAPRAATTWTAAKSTTQMTTEEPTNGELSRHMDRLEKAMADQFTALREEIRALAFVQPAVYAADMIAYRERMDRLDADLDEERRERREAEKQADQRSWQVRMAMAVLGAVLSVATAIVTAALK